MDTTPNSSSVPSGESAPATTLDTSTHKIFGVPRRAIAFGFGLLLMLIVLAVLYAQFTRQPMPMPQESMAGSKNMMPKEQQMMAPQGQSAAATGTVTPDQVADDLIDEALSDRDDLSGYDADEMADVEDGSNN